MQAETLAELLAGRHESATQLLRAITADLAYRRYADGLTGSLGIEEGKHALSLVEDPRARTSFAYVVAYTLGLKSRYIEAAHWIDILRSDVQAYELEFARPYADWTTASVKLGLRRFGEAERWLQSVEDAVAVTHDPRHSLNARMLRARLLLQTGKSDEAVELISERVETTLFAAWEAEYTGTRALALACTYRTAEALKTARRHEVPPAESRRLS